VAISPCSCCLVDKTLWFVGWKGALILKTKEKDRKIANPVSSGTGPIFLTGLFSGTRASSALLVFSTSLHLSPERPKYPNLPADLATRSLCHMTRANSFPSSGKVDLIWVKNPFPCLKDQHTLTYLCSLKSLFSKNQQSVL